jgi:hypothetical protein
MMLLANLLYFPQWALKIGIAPIDVGLQVLLQMLLQLSRVVDLTFKLLGTTIQVKTVSMTAEKHTSFSRSLSYIEHKHLVHSGS